MIACLSLSMEYVLSLTVVEKAVFLRLFKSLLNNKWLKGGGAFDATTKLFGTIRTAASL